jgi:hypothetical protein
LYQNSFRSHTISNMGLSAILIRPDGKK